MTWDQWGAIIAIALVLVVLGAVAGWVFHDTRHHDHLTARRFDVMLGVVFMVVALVISADVINLQRQFRIHVTEHVRCMEDATGHLTKIALARRDVDSAAARYDEHFILWLSDGDGPGSANRRSLEAALRDVKDARSEMVKVYDDNPPVEC